MAQHGSSDEMDLGIILNRTKRFYHSFLIWIYGIFRFLVKNVIFIGILFILGLILGYFLNQSKKYDQEAALIVQINFKGGNYVYNAIEQLNNKIIEKDSVFLNEIGLLQEGKLTIKTIEISPIVSLSEFLKKTTVNDRNVDLFLQQAQYENQVLTSEIFIPEYKAHKINLVASPAATDETIKNLLLYLNDNKHLQESKAITIENAEFQLRENQLTVSYIDSILKQKGSRELTQAIASQVYVNTREGSNDQLHLLLEEKRVIMEEIQEVQIELLKYDHPVVVLNNPVLQKKTNILSNNILFYPIFFLSVFFVISILFSLFRKAKRLSDGEV